MQELTPLISEEWKMLLNEEFQKAYFDELRFFLQNEHKEYKVFPCIEQIFSAFNLTPFSEIKVVIIGQDPYHGEGQANGLCFSVSHGVRQPPSLKNIFKELRDDLGIPLPGTGNLESWAKQGVLLLNATLTVRANSAGSHQRIGWETFTDAVIKKISDEKDNVIFLLWGNYARNKAPLINAEKHHILTAPHPSPLARGGFFGCKHFSKTNELLAAVGKTPVDWRIE